MFAGLLARLGATLAGATTFALLMGGCGGKSGETGTGSGGSTQGSGGSQSSGGSSSSGGSGGTLNCATVRCAAPTCPGGEIPIKPPGECCPSCPAEPGCANVLCDDFQCQSGSHAEVPAGECCHVCVFDNSCEAGKTGWQTRFDTLTAELDAFSCNVTEDCTVRSLGSLCKFDCGTAVNVSSAESLSAQLNAWGEDACVSCPQTGAACPPVVLSAVCTNGVCTLSPG